MNIILNRIDWFIKENNKRKIILRAENNHYLIEVMHYAYTTRSPDYAIFQLKRAAFFSFFKEISGHIDSHRHYK